MRFAVILYLLYCCFFSPLVPAERTGAYDVALKASDTERVCIVDDNDEALLWRLRLIRSATRRIDIATWELEDDDTSHVILAALSDAASRGVQVRLLIDGLQGQSRLSSSTFFYSFVNCENVRVRFYNPAGVRTMENIHYRMHEKYLIVDDTAYLLGGRNIGDTYLKNGAGASDTFEDRDILVYETAPGDSTSLADLGSYFETVWAISTPQQRYAPQSTQEAFYRSRDTILQKTQAQYGSRLDEYDLYAETIGTNGITFLCGTIDPVNKEPVLWKQLCQLMSGATESIIFQTPQLMASDEMRGDLLQLVQQLGESSLELITNVVEKSVNISGADHDNQREGILETGVAIYECADAYPIHTKTILIDENLSVVGSFNLDPRSTYLDTEIMIVIDSPELNALLRQKAESLKMKSRLALSDGSFEYGDDYVAVELPESTQKFYAFMTKVLRYFEYLL